MEFGLLALSFFSIQSLQNNTNWAFILSGTMPRNLRYLMFSTSDFTFQMTRLIPNVCLLIWKCAYVSLKLSQEICTSMNIVLKNKRILYSFCFWDYTYSLIKYDWLLEKNWVKFLKLHLDLRLQIFTFGFLRVVKSELWSLLQRAGVFPGGKLSPFSDIS